MKLNNGIKTWIPLMVVVIVVFVITYLVFTAISNDIESRGGVKQMMIDYGKDAKDIYNAVKEHE